MRRRRRKILVQNPEILAKSGENPFREGGVSARNYPDVNIINISGDMKYQENPLQNIDSSIF